MSATLLHQGRARGLYDEQLQRQHQEKLLIRGANPDKSPPALFQSAKVPAEA